MELSYPNSDHSDAPLNPQPVRAPERGGMFPNSDHTPPRENPPAQPDPSMLDFSFTEKQFDLPEGTPVDELPAEIRELRESDPDRKMFSPQHVYADSVKDYPGEGDDVKAFRAELREQFCDVGLSGQEAQHVVQIANVELRDGVPEQHVVDQWTRQSLDAVHRQYGAQAEARLLEARALVNRDPRLKAMLDRTGLGSHPDVVRLILEKARSQRAAGRLKVK